MFLLNMIMVYIKAGIKTPTIHTTLHIAVTEKEITEKEIKVKGIPEVRGRAIPEKGRNLIKKQYFLLLQVINQ
jgi:hypothetical protein